MTSQSMVTIVAQFERSKLAKALSAITTLKNPADANVASKVEVGAEGRFLHFASIHAIASSDGISAFIVLEFSADGERMAATELLAERWDSELRSVFALAKGWNEPKMLGDYLWSKRVSPGYILFGPAGVGHCGTPGHTVPDILREDALARALAKKLSKDDGALPPLARLNALRKAVAGEEALAWALETPRPPLTGPAAEPSALGKAKALALPFLATFTWPLLIILMPLALWLLWPHGWPEALRTPEGVLGWIRLITDVAWYAFKVVVLTFASLAAILGLAYAALRRLEKSDWLSDRSPDPKILDDILAVENHPLHAQNHMISHTVIKPGLLRFLTIRLAFFAVAKLTALNPKPGHLGDIGTIHFARWVQIPGTRDLLFLSNYGGSWESYLEDFITKAHDGLTAVWSNTVGFPRSKNLFQDGATDGERFKRYARQSMTATPFWYSAYPDLTTANIRTNALIRRGFATAMTEDEAVTWLALFGSSPRPIDKLETTQIQSLVFGGLGFKPAGRLLTITLSNDAAANRAWLAKAFPRIAFNDGRYLDDAAVLTLSLTAQGLRKLGLPESAIATFPAAFLGGMAGPGRERILGDTGANASSAWRWGKGDAIDIALLVYGNDDTAVGDLCAQVSRWCEQFNCEIRQEITLSPVDQSPNKRIEPFGFVDGVSQPAIRGTYRGLRNADPIHLVEPGEFVLGYPDNRGNIPPGPMLDAQHDPELRLPIAGHAQGFAECTAENPRMIGHNGSFLVIRQLEQATDKFEKYCKDQAKILRPAVANLPVDLTPAGLAELVGAKLIGRWKDGSSLVRFPYMSATTLRVKFGKDTGQAAARPEAKPLNLEATPVEHASPPVDSSTPGEAKPVTRPDNDFLFGTEDPQGLRCPFGAHVRRVNPRDSFDPGSQQQIEIVNRHRIIRVGRGYPGKDGKSVAGLMFMCLAGDIERQFEFIQQTWMGSTKFHGLNAESDPIVANGVAERCGFTVPTRGGPVALSPMEQFVTMRGGGYFFMPGRQFLGWLATPKTTSGSSAE